MTFSTLTMDEFWSGF